MADIMVLIAAVEWMVLGLLVLWKLKKWNQKYEELYNRLEEDIEDMERMKND